MTARADEVRAVLARLGVDDIVGVEEIEEAVATTAIDLRVAIAFVYKGERRVLSPYDVRKARNGHRLLLGFDHERQALRHFHVRELSAVEAAGEEYIAPEEA